MNNEATIEQRLISEMKLADGKWRNEGILTMHFSPDELTPALNALRNMADSRIISYRSKSMGAFSVKEYRYHEDIKVRLNRGNLKVVK